MKLIRNGGCRSLLGKATDWNDFVKRTEAHFSRLDATDLKDASSLYDSSIQVEKDNEQLIVKLDTAVEDLSIYLP